MDIRATADIRLEPNIRGAGEQPEIFDIDLLGQYADIEIVWNLTHGSPRLVNGDLATDGGLQTAVIISLFTDARADDDAELPAGERDPRGWWGDKLGSTSGDVTGSKLWLLSREKQEKRVMMLAEQYARESLQWLVDDRVAEKITVAASNPRQGWLYLEPAIYRARQRVTSFKFDYNWRAQEFRLAS